MMNLESCVKSLREELAYLKLEVVIYFVRY